MKLKLLDRYVLREFVKFLLLFVAGVILIFIVVHFFERLDKFLEKKPAPFSIAKYYIYQLPYLFVLLLPIAHILATFFSLGEMSRRNELLALKAAGIDVVRVIRPLLLLALFNSFLSFGVSEFLAPSANRKAREVKDIEIEKRRATLTRTFARNLSFWGEGRRLFYFRSIDARRNVARGIVMMEFAGEKLRWRIDAERGLYIDGNWKFFGVTERKFIGDSEEVSFYEERDMPEIKESPFDFLKGRRDLLEMGVVDLMELISSLKRAGLDHTQESVEFNIRFSFPLANLVMILFALPFAASMRGAGRAYGFGQAVFFSFIYWGFLETFRVIGEVGKLPPFVAAWAPNFLFLALALLGFKRLKR